MKLNRYSGIFLGLLLLDHGTKFVAESKLTFYKEIPILPFLSFIKVHNYGAAYGIFQNQQVFLIGLSFTILMLGWANRYKLANNSIGFIGLTVIASGAIGNLIDRVIRGYVVDFIDIQIIPVFNIADILINIGILCLIWDSWKTSTEH